jgi:F-type H+-transporting ATPase subunit gamma
MLAIRDIRRKIRSVTNIQQICRAMKTISGIKLLRAELRVNAVRPYLEGLRAALPAAYGSGHRLTREREVRSVGVILITGDKGLCGSYNNGAIQLANQQADQPGFAALGRKGADFLRRRGLTARISRSPLGAEPRFHEVAALADAVSELFLEGTWDEVRLVYTPHPKAGQPRPQAADFLPIRPQAPRFAIENVLFQPARAPVLDILLPRYLSTLLYAAVLESIASEHASRVTAMTLATDNAEKMINNLTLEFNKARQDAITSDLLDIVGTAEAVR